jgi:hypothetical protein
MNDADSLIIEPILKNDIIRLNDHVRKALNAVSNLAIDEDYTFLWSPKYRIRNLSDTTAFDSNSVRYIFGDHYMPYYVGAKTFLAFKGKPDFPMEFAYFQDANIYRDGLSDQSIDWGYNPIVVPASPPSWPYTIHTNTYPGTIVYDPNIVYGSLSGVSGVTGTANTTTGSTVMITGGTLTDYIQAKTSVSGGM